MRDAHRNLLHNVVKCGYRYEISCAEIAILDKITLDSLIESHEIRMHSKMTLKNTMLIFAYFCHVKWDVEGRDYI